MTREDTPVTNPVVVLREEFDDWAVLFNPDTAYALGVNPVGVAVWKLLDGKRSLGEVVALLKDSFEGVPSTVEAEVLAFADELARHGFIGQTSEVGSG